MRTKPVQLSVMAVAALAVVAVAAAMLLIGGAPAQATTATFAPPTGDGIDFRPVQEDPPANPTPTPTPTPEPEEEEEHPQPEACPNPATPVFSSGRLALFDVYWDTGSRDPKDKDTLRNNPCPPTVTWVPEREDTENETTIPAHETRDSPPTVNIDSTVIHVLSKYKKTLGLTNTAQQKLYPFMFLDTRDAKGNPYSANAKSGDKDGVPDELLNDHVWVLPTCDPGYSDSGTPSTDPGYSSSSTPATEAVAGDDDLCLIFSAALLDAAHWVTAVGETMRGPVRFEYVSGREKLVTPSERGQIFAFQPYNATGVTAHNQVTWDTTAAATNGLAINPGAYQYRQWAFSEAGTYILSVQVVGHPDPDHHPGKTLTSEVRQYIFHVGLEADLGVDVTVEAADSADTSLDPGDNVTITVTASNAGPDTATNTKVKVTLPAGLTYSSHNTATGTYTPGPDVSTPCVWTTGDLAVTNDDNTDTSDDSPTLEITATVADNTRGQDLKVKATISATETVITTEVPVLDQNPDNDMGMDSITVTSIPNTAPMFKVLMSVAENSAAGTPVGDPIGVMDPDEGETLTFALTGEGADNFTATGGDGEVQIEVATGADLDYETTSSYDLTLTVSDSVDHEGNDDDDVDDSIKLRINLSNVVEGDLGLTITPDHTTRITGEDVTFTTVVAGDFPTGATDVTYVLRNGSVQNTVEPTGFDPAPFWTVTNDTPGQRFYQARVEYTVNGTPHAVNSPNVTVTWQAASK